MSGKAYKRARRLTRQVAAQILRRREAERHLPKWRTLLLALGFKGPARRWVARWEAGQRKWWQRGIKEGSHAVVEYRREKYRMRKGAPATSRTMPVKKGESAGSTMAHVEEYIKKQEESRG